MKKPIGSKKEQLFDKMTSQGKIAGILYKYPTKEFSLTDISKLAGVSKSMASELILDFAKNEFIILEQLGKKIWRIRANVESNVFKKWKITSNLTNIYQSGILEFLGYHFNSPKAIILFGSFRWGEDRRGSDIDIAIETLEEKELEILRFDDLIDIENAFERTIKIHIFNRKNIDINLFNNIANGIILSGFLEVKK